MRKIRACLFGAGRMGRSHAKHIEESPFATLYAVCDLDMSAAEEVAGEFGAKAYQCPQEALRDPQIEAVVIVSPTSTHTELIKLSAEAKLPIFCEKPIDMSLEKTDACLEVVKRYNVPLFVAFNRRFDPSIAQLRRRLHSGEIGEVHLLNITSRDSPFPSVDYLKVSGGIFRDMTIHDFDMARWLLQEEPEEIYAVGSCMINKELESFGDVDTAMVVMKTANGAMCHINNSRDANYGYDQRIEAFGPKGMLRSNNLLQSTVELADGNGARTDRIHPSFPERYQEAYKLEVDHFFRDVVCHGEAPLVTGDDARQAMALAEAATTSLELGIPVKVRQRELINIG